MKDIGEKKFVVIPFFGVFEMLKKKIWANFQRIIELFTQKIVGLGSGIRDPGSGKKLFRIQGSKRHRIPDADPHH
jgi:hypothetical protein